MFKKKKEEMKNSQYKSWLVHFKIFVNVEIEKQSKRKI